MLYVDLEPVFQAEQEFERAINRFDEDVRRGAQRAIDAGVREAINSRVYEDETGLLTSRIKGWVEVSTPGGVYGYFGAFTDYASFVEYGTRPHEIHGNPFLTFKGRDGTWVTTTMVHHPGTKPDGFVARGLATLQAIWIQKSRAESQRCSGTSMADLRPVPDPPEAPRVTGYPQRIEVQTGDRYRGPLHRMCVDAMVAMVFKNAPDVEFKFDGGRLRCFVTCIPTSEFGPAQMQQAERRIRAALVALGAIEPVKAVPAKEDPEPCQPPPDSPPE